MPNHHQLSDHISIGVVVAAAADAALILSMDVWIMIIDTILCNNAVENIRQFSGMLLLLFGFVMLCHVMF